MIPPSLVPPDNSTCWQWWSPPPDGILPDGSRPPPKGCDYKPCQDAVCACDDYCCNSAWDLSCRGDASGDNSFVDKCSAKFLCCEPETDYPIPTAQIIAPPVTLHIQSPVAPPPVTFPVESPIAPVIIPIRYPSTKTKVPTSETSRPVSGPSPHISLIVDYNDIPTIPATPPKDGALPIAPPIAPPIQSGVNLNLTVESENVSTSKTTTKILCVQGKSGKKGSFDPCITSSGKSKAGKKGSNYIPTSTISGKKGSNYIPTSTVNIFGKSKSGKKESINAPTYILNNYGKSKAGKKDVFSSTISTNVFDDTTASNSVIIISSSNGKKRMV